MSAATATASATDGIADPDPCEGYSGDFFQDISRAEAERILLRSPQRPILRPCSYTTEFPMVFAVSYVLPGGFISHALVERLGNGLLSGGYCAVMDTHQESGCLRMRRTDQDWASEEEVFTYFKERSTRFPCHLQERGGLHRSVLHRSGSGAHDILPASALASASATATPTATASFTG